MLRPEHEHTDADPVCLYLTMECVEPVDIWVVQAAFLLTLMQLVKRYHQ